ncbi:hypothetical protein AV530_002706 [Patagioenas fasciata monilis]|uniref:Uncharacterized protein n=1 Tax=Patagioenas fasciata monilis TaxID=372326 RepID=A0A1V4IPN5_PATFA|nr:hypothetical protein AV530_002706 [Patagioenas fasciata monilis]
MSPLNFCFTRTLISCGFLGPGPIRWWIATSAACMKVHHNISDLQRACFGVQQGHKNMHHKENWAEGRERRRKLFFYSYCGTKRAILVLQPATAQS